MINVLLVPLVDQELLTIPVHLSSPPAFSVRVTRSLVLCVCFVHRLLSLCTFSLCILSFRDGYAIV